MSAENLDIDLTAISFPSDKLTVKDLRSLYPNSFDQRGSLLNWLAENSGYERLAEFLFEERGLAINAYEQARGIVREDGFYGEELDEIRTGVSNLYVRFGLAAGPAHAEELARSVQRQAEQQAERHAGRRP